MNTITEAQLLSLRDEVYQRVCAVAKTNGVVAIWEPERDFYAIRINLVDDVARSDLPKSYKGVRVVYEVVGKVQLLGLEGPSSQGHGPSGRSQAHCLPAHLSGERLASLARWTRWNGWCSLGFGALMAVSLVGLPLAWLPVWQGLVLVRSAGHLDALVRSGDPEQLRLALERSSFQFVLQVAYYLGMGLYFGVLVAVAAALGLPKAALGIVGG